MDPYKVLCLGKNFTLEELRANYKRLALQLHPDKCRLDPSTSNEVFKVLTLSYKALLKELESRAADKTFMELKSGYVGQQNGNDRNNGSGGSGTAPIHSGGTAPPDHGKKFNVERFNAVFSQNKMQSAEDAGYQEWMEKNEPGRPPSSAPVASNNERSKKDVVIYKEPEAVLAVRGLSFHELGADGINDFSKPQTMGRHAIQFTDYKLAHTTDKLVHEDEVEQRRAYKNVQEVEAERAALRYVMSSKEMDAYQEYLREREAREERRAQALRRYDEEAERHSQRVNRLLLAGPRGGGGR
jgi:curved DNA-binding protein CbpA